MKSILRLPLILWAGFSLLVYASVLVSPLIFKYSGVISFGVPLIILMNLSWLVLSLIFKWKSGFVALFLLIVAYPFLNVGISLEGPQSANGKTLKVLNYNVMRYNLPRTESGRTAVSDWILSQDADIICLQEYPFGDKYAKKVVADKRYRSFLGGYANSFAIFSKFPIIKTGQLFENDHTNNATFIDVKIDKDTLRVYNIHLQSMGIDPNKIQSTEGIRDEYEIVTNKFLSANVERTRQIERLIEDIKEVDHRVLLAGDFNDVPFSYNYFQIRKRFKNAFEEVGRGFGISYNGKIPYLRIDNQFYSEGLRAISLLTLNDIYFSDHFPLVGIYEITP